jgi:glycosyltransferase involved in cell wall biosynthesis
VDTTYYCPSEGDEREKGLIVAVGRILPHKGFDRIIRALPKGLKLVIAGTVCDQAYSSMLAELIQSSGSDVVILEGLDDDDIRNLVRKASLFVHASTHVDYRGTYYAKPELLGLAPLEALVSNAGSLPELGAIVGCDVFFSDDDLKKSLASFANGVVSSPPSSIYESVRKLYGIEQYGEKLLAELIAMGEAA